jgi:hypothetical protein
VVLGGDEGLEEAVKVAVREVGLGELLDEVGVVEVLVVGVVALLVLLADDVHDSEDGLAPPLDQRPLSLLPRLRLRLRLLLASLLLLLLLLLFALSRFVLSLAFVRFLGFAFGDGRRIRRRRGKRRRR